MPGSKFFPRGRCLALVPVWAENYIARTGSVTDTSSRDADDTIDGCEAFAPREVDHG
jgi:hypothetical protein